VIESRLRNTFLCSLICSLSFLCSQPLEIWDNDGIVNTAAMLWPDGLDTRLVRADHGDIIGHYRLVQAIGGAREYHTYDLLRSDSGFTDAQFSAVWQDVFSFCAAGAGP